MQLEQQKNQATTLYNSKFKIFRGMLPFGGASVETYQMLREREEFIQP